MPGASAAALSGSAALAATRGAHPTLRLDTFLRNTDAGYQHAEAGTQGDRFIRKMATYGHVRPSVSFTSEPRVSRPFKEHNAVDTSNLPPTVLDPKGDPREGTLSYPQPPKDVDDSFIKLYKNHSLMLPSERYKEHLYMKQAERKWREDRDNIFRYRKRMQVLERHYPNGVIGLDGPMHPDTKLYAERRQQLVEQEERRAVHGEGRMQHLYYQNLADDATAARSYGSDPNLARSRDICAQRKRVDPEAHPWRFMDTHERLFPSHMPTWDPERAAAIRAHDTRGRTHNIISGTDNTLELKVAKRWDLPPLPGMPNIAHHPGYEPPGAPEQA